MLLIDAPNDRWEAASHRLGRGTLRPDHVWVGRDGFRLRLTAATCDGAEVRTKDRVGFGSYTARMRTPNAAGSLSAFFLYADVAGGNDEIDIELLNDGSRQALLTTWVAGSRSHELKLTLPFDPAEAFHDYTLAWSAAELVVVADDRQLARWTDGYPTLPMRAMASVWWPIWLDCHPLASDRELLIDRIRIRPAAR